MPSQLAAQLRQLSSLTTTAGRVGGGGDGSQRIPQAARVSHPSLLFSPQVAADTDVESIYHVAVSGVQALIAQAPALFSPFSSSLFHPATVSLDRASQKSDVAVALNKSLHTFLSRLSPFFLQPAAAQCLEYLLRRYEVHRYNAQAVLDMALPYHDSALFARLLSLLHLQPPSALSSFTFLAGRAAVPRSVLVAAAALDAAVMVHIAETTLSHPHTAQLGLYVSLGVELLARKDASDVLLQALTPHLLHGLDLGAHGAADYHAASLLLLVAVARVHPLEEAVVEAAVRGLALTMAQQPSTVAHSTAALAAVIQSQRSQRLSAAAVSALIHVRALVSGLKELRRTKDCDALVDLLLASLTHSLVEPASAQPALALRSPSLDAQRSPVLPATATPAETVSRSTQPTEVLSLLRSVVSSLPLSAESVTRLLDEVLKAAERGARQFAAAAGVADRLQLPVRVMHALSEVFRTVDSDDNHSAVDSWVQRVRARRNERDRRQDLHDVPDNHNFSDSSAASAAAAHNGSRRKRSRKSEEGETATGGASAVEGGDGSSDDAAAAPPERKDRKRKRRRDRHAVVTLGSSPAALVTHLLVHLTRGTRHAVVDPPAVDGEDGLSTWQLLWSDDDDARLRGLTALQKLQSSSSNSSPSPAHRFNAAQVEEVISDALLSSSLPVVRRLFSLTALLSSLPADRLQAILLRFMWRHTVALQRSTVPSETGAARLSIGGLVEAFTFLSSFFLPLHSEALSAFLPLYLEYSLLKRDTAKLNTHVRGLMASMHRLSPLFLHLPSSLQSSTITSASMEDENQRWVELLAKNAWKDRSDGTLRALLAVFERRGEEDERGRPTGVWCSGLTLDLVFDLRTEKAGDRSNRPKNDDGEEVPTVRRFFDAITAHFAHADADESTRTASAAAPEGAPSFFSASPALLGKFLRYLLDRLAVRLAPIADRHGRGSSAVHSSRAALVRDVLVFLLSVPDVSSVEKQISHLLSHHVHQPAAAFAFLTPLFVPSLASTVPVACSLRALQLWTAQLESAASFASAAGPNSTGLDEPLLVPTLLAAATSWSRAIRHAAIVALLSWRKQITSGSTAAKVRRTHRTQRQRRAHRRTVRAMTATSTICSIPVRPTLRSPSTTSHVMARTDERTAPQLRVRTLASDTRRC